MTPYNFRKVIEAIDRATYSSLSYSRTLEVAKDFLDDWMGQYCTKEEADKAIRSAEIPGVDSSIVLPTSPKTFAHFVLNSAHCTEAFINGMNNLFDVLTESELREFLYNTVKVRFSEEESKSLNLFSANKQQLQTVLTNYIDYCKAAKEFLSSI